MTFHNMLTMFKNLLKIHPILVSTAILLLLFMILLFVDSNNLNDIKNNLISGTSTEIVGAIITLLIVQVLLDKYDANLEERKERQKIINSSKILNIFIRQYELLLVAMTNDYDEYEKSIRDQNLYSNFDITKLQYAHNICLLLTKSTFFSNVHIFLKNELELREFFISTIQNIDFYFHKDIYQQIQGYVETSIQYDVREAIEQNDNIIRNEWKQSSSKLLDLFKDLMINHIEKFINSLNEQTANPSNLMYPYVLLYQMINTEKEYLCKYQELIEALRNKK